MNKSAALAKPTEGWRVRPVYSISQTAKLADTSSVTVRRWLYGVDNASTRMKPVFKGFKKPKDQPIEVSFLQLAEIVVVSRFRKRNVKLSTLRDAHSFAQDYLKIEYPFAHLRLKTDGAHVLSAFEQEHPNASMLTLDKHGQLTLPGNVIQALELFDYEEEFAARWFPLGRSVPIVIDPRFGAGRPTIPDRRLPIATLYNRWKAGQKIEFLASDFCLPKGEVEQALRYAENYAI